MLFINTSQLRHIKPNTQYVACRIFKISLSSIIHSCSDVHNNFPVLENRPNSFLLTSRNIPRTCLPPLYRRIQSAPV